MTPGLNEAQLVVRARTTDLFADTLRISTRSTILALARIVDVEVSDMNGIVPLDAPSVGVISPNVSPWTMRGYTAADGPLTIKNTGNMDLAIRVFRRTSETHAIYDESDLWLSVGRDTTIEREHENMAFRINGNNTISNPELLPIQYDGFIYLLYR